MGCIAVFRPVILTHPYRNSPSFTSLSVSPNSHNSSTCGCRIATSVRHSGFLKHDHNQLNCYNQYNPSSSSSSMENEHEAPQDAILKVISDISRAEGRIGRTSTMILGGTMSDDSTYDRLSLTKMSNIYPASRGFTAIGSGGDDFVQSMVVAVESVVQHPIPQGKVKQKLSSGGKYVSVNIGPVQIVSSKQVQAVYYAMKRDNRMRYFL
ncbi:putative YbeD-like domain superfamily protein [Helianthus debilis subsp. tardiflorus]